MLPFRNNYKAMPKPKPHRPVLLPSGENMFEVEPQLGHEHHNLRKKISAAQAWPIAGDWHVKNFLLFPKLPRELRNKIWSFAVSASEPRVVNIYVAHGKLHCSVVTPKIFHACSESRQEAVLNYYSLVFDGIFSGCYVNFDIDWILFDTAIPLLKVFGQDAQYPIFQKKCRKLALMQGPLSVYGKTMRRFAKLEELALIHNSNTTYYGLHGQGNPGRVNFISRVADDIHDPWADTLRRELDRLVKQVSIPVVSVVDVHREGAPRIMSSHEKQRERMKRQRERELIAPVRADENMAYKLQYEIDHRTAGPAEDAAEAEAAAQAGDLDEDMFDEDEFGLAYGIDHGIFSEDFMLYN